ncbi:MAG: hypothetical protein ACOC2E_08285, partial [Bacteroidota bacterium]
INGLTLAGVGNQTTISHIEVISNYDDGFEFFGGTVNCKYLISAFNGDDSYDFDLGYQGKLQYLLAIQDPSSGDNLFEIDGGTAPETGTPYTKPTIYNGTFIGRGRNGLAHTVSYQRNGAGIFANSIFFNQDKGVDLEYKTTNENSYNQYKIDNIRFSSCLFYNIADNSDSTIFTVSNPDEETSQTLSKEFVKHFEEGDNIIIVPSLSINSSYDVMPDDSIHFNLASPPDKWFDDAQYRGAFHQHNWAKNWTLLDQSGNLE